MSGAAGAQTGAPPSQLNHPHIKRNVLPARACIEAKLAGPDILVEIAVVAVK